MTTQYKLLLSPIKIGNLTLANRIVMPPMVIYRAGDDGMVTVEHAEHYKLRSGPGLIFVEGTAVLPEGRSCRRQLGIHNDRHIDGLSRLAAVIHEGGAVAGIQIHHAGATAFKETGGSRSGRLAGVAYRLARQHLMFSGLIRIREAFKAAARRAIEAGFDIVEIHGAHGYLFTQLLSPLTNWRFDRYGGKIEKRRRFLLEVFRDIRSDMPERALLTCRLGVADGHRGGLPLSEGLSTAIALENEGVKLLDISNGSGTPSYPRPPGSLFSVRLDLAHKAKSALSIPVIGGGGIFHPDLAEKALQEGMADLIYIGRGLLADPAWARKTIEGRPTDIVGCRQCRVCLFHSDLTRCPARRERDHASHLNR